MKTVKSFFRRRLLLVGLLTSVSCLALVVEGTGGIPNIFNPLESAFQNQTHFLVFTGSDTPAETVKTSTAYYNAIDPNHNKLDFPHWLLNAGFINDLSQWHASGPQVIACDLGQAAGCDVPAHDSSGNLVYGDNIVNTDSHAIVLNAADLGFVRNQFIRCVPSCAASNPKVYTYLENYPVNPFAASGAGGSGFPTKTGFPTQAEGALAIASALNRPSVHDLATCDPTTTDTPFKCKISRIADVAFEWAPPPTNLSSSSRYGQLYAYIFDDSGSTPTETIAFPTAGGSVTPNVKTHALEAFHGGLTVDPNPNNNNAYTGVVGDPFPPNLDFIGFKQHPGVCFICHGGKPRNLTSTGAYPNQGNVSGFRFLPLDNRNLIFSSISGGEQPASNGSLAYTDQSHQELQIKEYNIAVLLTVPKGKEFDGQVSRQTHLREVVTGWYTDSGGPAFGRATQNSDFIPVGWREPGHGGTAPPNSEQLYVQVVGPSCRSCHFNRETSLDFGTYQNFMQESDILQLALLPFCKSGNPDRGAKAMPLAHLTYQRYWQANRSTGGANITLPDGFSIADSADQIARYFGFSSTAGYCATNP